MNRRTPDGLTDALLRWTLPLAEPPQGPLLDPDELAALGEGRTTPAEEARLRRLVDASAAAREELRALYPERFQALFGGATAAPPPARILAFPRRHAPALAGATLAAAAGLTLALLPAGPPAGADLTVAFSAIERGVGPGEARTVSPGQPVELFARLGTPGWLARLRGETPWAAIAVWRKGAAGLERVEACATGPGSDCQVSATTAALRFLAPSAPGDYLVSLLSGVGPPLTLPRTLPPGELTGLARAARAELRLIELHINP